MSYYYYGISAVARCGGGGGGGGGVTWSLTERTHGTYGATNL